MTKKVRPLSPFTSPPLLCPDLVPVFIAHENPWFKVLSRNSYFTIEYDRPQVVVLPILEGNSVIMVRVRRPLINDDPLEFPAGDSEEGETPRMAAMREFAEETGIVIKDPKRFIPELPISEMPGRIPVLLSVFRIDVTQNEFDVRLCHDKEIISVEIIPFIEATRMLCEGEIYLSSPAAILSRLLLKYVALVNTDKE
jgi:8-oxo-dGTP pyrophosphatase MutT (NUDIX family)